MSEQGGEVRCGHLIPEGWDWMAYDPTRDAVLSLPVTSQAVLVTTGDGVVRVLDDQSTAQPWTTLNDIQRAVLVTRLRAWADIIAAPTSPGASA